LCENHAQLRRHGGRLAEQNDPANHQQYDHDPISTLQSKPHFATERVADHCACGRARL
jgi:hypothetical protein